ncbi:MAG: hypothetical protein Q7U28_16745 [Aquabacterium sp.]|nr:hypothetical protein [Aquabacterium sp.]
MTVSANDGVWEPLRQGVMIKPLFGVGDRVSMLARVEVGAASQPTFMSAQKSA